MFRAALVAALGAVLSAVPAAARPGTAAKPTGKSAAKASVKRSSPAARRAAKVVLPPPVETFENVSDEQLAVVPQVLTGSADCEFNQRVEVLPVVDRPGHFTIGFNSKRYKMVPLTTTSGAVRLEDRAAGVAWLQIPAKSMLMNTRIGQRMVDSCVLAQQREANADSLAMAARGGDGTGLLRLPSAAPAQAPAPTDLPPDEPVTLDFAGFFGTALPFEPFCHLQLCNLDGNQVQPVFSVGAALPPTLVARP